MNIVLLGLLAIVVVFVLANVKKLKPAINGFKRFTGEVAFEMGKVTWPTRTEVVNSTILVVIVAAMLTILVWIIDRFFGWLVSFIF